MRRALLLFLLPMLCSAAQAVDFRVAVEAPTKVLEYQGIVHLNVTAWAPCTDVAQAFDVEGLSGIQFGLEEATGVLGGAGDAVPFSAQRNCNAFSVPEAASCPPDASIADCVAGYPWARATGQIHVFAYAEAPANRSIPAAATVVGHTGAGLFNLSVGDYVKWVTPGPVEPFKVGSGAAYISIPVVVHANAPVEFTASAHSVLGELEVERAFSIPSPLAAGSSRAEVPVELKFTPPRTSWVNTTADLLVTAKTANMPFPVLLTVSFRLDFVDLGGARPVDDAGEATPALGPALLVLVVAAAAARRR